LTRAIPIAVAAAVILAWAAAPAQAVTRAEYIAHADPICRAVKLDVNKKARKVFRGMRKEEKRGGENKRRSERRSLHALGGLYGYLGKKMLAETAQLRRLGLPPGDEAGLTEWLLSRDEVAKAYLAAARAARHNKFNRFLLGLFATGVLQKEAEKLVGGYGFRQCVRPTKAPQL
jgi:hypothetical protein